MTVSSGYENKGYDGDNPVKVIIFAELNHFFHRNQQKTIFYRNHMKKNINLTKFVSFAAPIT